MSAHDKRRFRAFADFIRMKYPNVETIADVAGGHGQLSYFLHGHGYEATVVDARNAHLPRSMHRALRKQSVKLGKLIEIPRIACKVQEVDLRPFDLIVGLHPDEATEHAVRAAIKLGKDFAMVPCCVFPMDGVTRSEEKWLEYLASLSTDIVSARLPVDGANIVVYRCVGSEPDKRNRREARQEICSTRDFSLVEARLRGFAGSSLSKAERGASPHYQT